MITFIEENEKHRLYIVNGDDAPNEVAKFLSMFGGELVADDNESFAGILNGIYRIKIV